MTVLLEVKSLQKVYTTRFGGNSVTALSNVNFSVEKGEYIAIMGESGSGKTTLLNILAAIDRPTKGQVLLNGEDITSISEKEISAFRRNNLGFVFQDFNLLDTFNLKDNIFLPLVLSGKKYQEMNKRIKPLAAKLGITDLLYKYPYEVSGGQKQRAAVARALITNPQLVLADEPTGALDSRSADDLLKLFADINREGQTILMVTHSVKAASHASRILFISDGAVFHQMYRGNATSEEMFQQHFRHPDDYGDGRWYRNDIDSTPAWRSANIIETAAGRTSAVHDRLHRSRRPSTTSSARSAGNEQSGGACGAATSSRTYMGVGQVIVSIFAVIFLFYVNSFLLKRRRKLSSACTTVLGHGKAPRNEDHRCWRLCTLIWQSPWRWEHGLGIPSGQAGCCLILAENAGRRGACGVLRVVARR